MTRRARLLVEPLADWPHPDPSLVPSPFKGPDGRAVPWTRTRDELLREADHLGARTVVLEVDCERRHIRQDGAGPLADARLRSGRVRISMDTRHGPMRWALARYDAAGLSWQANVRGIVLTLENLRAVERYGVVTDGQQYRGFLAIEAQPAVTPAGLDLSDPDAARNRLAMLAGRAGSGDTAGALLRRARRRDDLTDDERTELTAVERALTGAGSVS